VPDDGDAFTVSWHPRCAAHSTLLSAGCIAGKPGRSRASLAAAAPPRIVRPATWEVNRPVSPRASGKPWRFNLYLYLEYVLARVCESFADWSHGKVQSVATVCPDAITVVLRVAGT